MGTVNWQYSDWRLQSTPAKQLERLKRHMEEVESFMVESASKARTLRLSDTLLPALQTQLNQLEAKIALQAGIGTFGVQRLDRRSST